MTRALTLALVLSFSLTPPAHAQDTAAPAPDPTLDEARRRLARGESLYDAEDYEGAYAEFQEVDRLLDGHPMQPLAVYDMARAAERLFRYEEAVALYEQYVAHPDPSATYVEVAQGKLAMLSTLLAEVTITVRVEDAPASIAWLLWIDGHLVGERRTSARVPGGRHTIEIHAPGLVPDRTEIEIASGRSVAITLRVGGPRGLSPEPFWIATSAAAVFAITAAILGPLALVQHDQLAACRDDFACAARAGWVAADGGPSAAFAAANDRALGLAIGTDVALALAAGSAIGAIVLGALTRFGAPEHADSETRLELDLAPTGLVLRGAL